jgi:hypothetical protein
LMGLFDWTDLLQFRLWFNVVRAHDLDQELIARGTRRADRAQEERFKIERTRWLEEKRAERSFPCGIVLLPDPASPAPKRSPRPEVPPPPPQAQAPSVIGAETPPTPPAPVKPSGSELETPLHPMPVIAAVLPPDVVFLLEEAEGDEVVEVGRIPRTAIDDIDVIDHSGAHIPEPIHETIEEPQLSMLILRWKNEGMDDEDRFAFRSPWMAWQAGRRLMDARRG